MNEEKEIRSNARKKKNKNEKDKDDVRVEKKIMENKRDGK